MGWWLAVPTLLSGIISLWAGQCRSQWVSAGIPFRILEMGNIHKDTVADALYFCGESSLNNDFDFSDGAVPLYSNGQWDTLGVFGGRVQTIVRWNDTLVIGGPFSGVDGVPSPRKAAYWSGSEWLPFGEFSEAIYRYKVIDGELYAIGAFDVVDGMGCQGIAKRMNGQWMPVGTFDVIDSPNIQDLVSWNGTLFATGTIPFGPLNPKDVAYLSSGGEWLPLGTGILGGFGAGRSLAVYNNELYVSGSIPIAAGNAGHGIMRWDGQQFHAVGTGFQGLDGTYSYLVGAIELEVHDNMLWASGTFSYAGNVPCPGIAYWDGVRWCGLPLGPEPEINTIEFFHDTLFASCHANLNGVPVNCAVRFTGANYSDTCSFAVGLPENIILPRSTLRAYRRADGQVEVSGLPPGKHHVEVVDVAGRLVFATLITATGHAPVSWAMPPLGGGLHVIRLGTQSVRFISP